MVAVLNYLIMDYDRKITDTRSELDFWQDTEIYYPKEAEGESYDNL
jgi:hypothetical protein